MMDHQYRFSYGYQHYNLYSILRVPCYTSNEAEIGKAFLKQSQLYHPNQNSDPRNVAWFEAIGHAYDVLKDSKSRTEYDKFLASSTQHEFNRVSQAAKQHSYLSWMAWDRKPETRSYWTSGNKTDGDNDSLMDRIQALQSEVSTLKATNSKIWAQASFHLAKTDCLLREKVSLQKQLDANQEAFHCRERGYVSRIRFLESTIASLRRSLKDQSKVDGKKTKVLLDPMNQSLANAKGPALVVELNAQPIGKSKTKDANNDSKTPTSSNLSQLPGGKDPVQKPMGLVLEAPREDESSKRKKSTYSMPSLVDKENLDDACKINVKRMPPSELNNNRLPHAKKQKCRKAFGAVLRGSNCS